MKDLCLHPKFRNGEVHTGFIEKNYESLFPKLQVPSRVLAEGALGLILHEEIDLLKFAMATRDSSNPFALETGVRINHLLNRHLKFQCGEENHSVDIKYIEPDVYSMRINDLGPWKKVRGNMTKQGNSLELKSDVDGIVQKSRIVKHGNEIYLFTNVSSFSLSI